MASSQGGYPGPLGDIEARMARTLKQVGRLPATASGELLPVVIASDALAPGNPVTSGRRFSFAVSIAAAAANFGVLAIAPGTDIVIEQFWLSSAAATVGRIAVQGVDEAKTYVPNAANVTWLENLTRGLDVAPALTLADNGSALQAGHTLWLGYLPTTTQVLVNLPSHYPAGTLIIVQSLLINTIFVAGFQGYLY